MRILTVCVSTHVFGAEIVTLKMLEGFNRAGHEQLAVTSIWTDGQFSRRLAALDIPEVRLPFGALSKRLALRPMWWTLNVVIRLPWLWIGWRRIVRRFRPDIVILTTWRHGLVLYPFIDRARFFQVEHTYLAPTRTRRTLYRLLSRKLSGFVAVSEFMRRHTIEIGAAREKVYVAKNGVFSASDPIFEAEPLRTARPSHGCLSVGIVGQIASHKGHHCLVEAIALLHKQHLAVDAYIFGTGEDNYVQALKDQIQNLGLEQLFNWMGYREDRAEIYGTFGVCIIPSLSGDPFPTVAMEAGAYARPVIASKTGGLPEIIEHGVTGWLTERNNAEDLALWIKEFITNPALSEKMGLAGRRRVLAKYSQERMISDFEEIFRTSTVNQSDEPRTAL